MAVALAIAVAASLFLLDTIAGLGPAASVAYALVVWIASFATWRPVLWAAAAACSLLVLIAAAIAPDGEAWNVIGGRGLAILTIWVAAGFTAFARRHRDDNHRHFAAIIESCNDAVIGITLDGIVTSWNRGAEALYGYAADEMIGQGIACLIPPDCSDDETTILERIRHGEPVESYETVRLSKDGARLDVTLTLSPIIGSRGEIVGASTIVHDITGRKQAEAALLRAKNEAERANTAKSRFLANMSHELRTPLNVIIGFAETMAQQRLGPIGNNRYHEYAADISASGQHLLDLINDVLDLSKVEAGRYELRESPVSVTRLVEGCVRLIKGWPHDGAPAVRTELPDSLPLLFCDERAVKQIIFNLVSNAVKFTPEDGSVTVIVRRCSDGGIDLTVRDTGIGIAQQHLSKVLKPFGMIDNPYLSRNQGTGLGLPLAKTLVELHGGILDVDSVVGAGTSVSVRFPRDRVIADDGQDALGPAALTA